MLSTMDINGKGSLLLLVVSTLVLCQNVASYPSCLEGERCHVILQDLNYEAIFNTIRMQLNSLDVFLEFTKQYGQEPFYFLPGIRRCHTAHIPVPTEQEAARLMEHKDIIHMVIRLLHSWNEFLTYLSLAAHRLPKLGDFLILKGQNISEVHQELKELTKKIARHLDPETKDNVDYVSWSGLPSLLSSDEKVIQFTFYNTLHCLLTDLQKIESLLVFLSCQVNPDYKCSDLPMHFVNLLDLNNTSFGII